MNHIIHRLPEGHPCKEDLIPAPEGSRYKEMIDPTKITLCGEAAIDVPGRGGRLVKNVVSRGKARYVTCPKCLELEAA